jgi:hypothetical protein
LLLPPRPSAHAKLAGLIDNIAAADTAQVEELVVTPASGPH